MTDAHAAPVPRVVGAWGPERTGPTLVAIAAVHGNEPAGVAALERVTRRLSADPPRLRGRFVALVGNRQALARRVRYVDLDLNRIWEPALVAELEAGSMPGPEVEYGEAAELYRELLAAHGSGPCYVLDLHTTSGESPPFAVLADTLQNRRFARTLGLPLVLGLEERLDGTLLSHLEQRGFITTGCEGGRHGDPAAIDHLEAAVWLALAGSGVLGADHPEVARARGRLRAAASAHPPVLEVRYRHPVTPDDRFRMQPGFASFGGVAAGQALATDRRGTVTAPAGGRLLMPLYQPQGSDGFFLMRPVRPFWLGLSALLRRIGAPALAHWLPGVRRDPVRPGHLLVDRGTARWLALEVFHLLGFRRQREEGDLLVVSRRPDR